jgi:hypothetical protein
MCGAPELAQNNNGSESTGTVVKTVEVYTVSLHFNKNFCA